MMIRKCLSWILLAAILTMTGNGLSLAQQVPPEDPVQEARLTEEEEEILPGPTNIKEGTAILVFVGWMWLSIIVLIFILRAKIKEVDRLHHIKFFNETDK